MPHKNKEDRRKYAARPENKQKKKEYDRQYRIANKNRIDDKVKKWIENNPEKYKKRLQNWVWRNTDKRKNIILKNQYGITLDDYNRMFEDQKGCCAICNKHQSELKRKLHVDHCHESNKVRGLLCQHCNTVLGLIRDDIPSLYRAIKYLISFHEL